MDLKTVVIRFRDLIILQIELVKGSTVNLIMNYWNGQLLVSRSNEIISNFKGAMIVIRIYVLIEAVIDYTKSEWNINLYNWGRRYQSTQENEFIFFAEGDDEHLKQILNVIL